MELMLLKGVFAGLLRRVLDFNFNLSLFFIDMGWCCE